MDLTKKLLVVFYFVLVVLAGVAACSGHRALRTKNNVAFVCDNGQTAKLQTTKKQLKNATLTLDNRSFSMYPVKSASGAKYATEQGITPESGLVFWTKGNTALLIEMVLDDTVKPEDYPVLALCRQQD